MSKLLSIAAPLALSYFAPGLGTAIGSGILGAGAAGASTLGSALLGAGTGALTGGGLKGALLGGAAGGIGANLGSLGSAGAGTIDSLGREVVLPASQGSGILGSIGSATGLSSESFPSIGGLSGGSGGGSTFSTGSGLTNLLSGYQENEALKKAQEQLLAGNNQQLQNLDSFDPSGITEDPGYEFNREQGEQGLNRSLGATGNLFSGRALKAASEYNQNYADNAFDDYYKRWLEKTQGQNSLYGNSGDVRASGTIARSNSLNKALGGVL